MDLDRPVERGEPFGASKGAAAAFFVNRQTQGGEERLHLLARGDVRQVRPRAERHLIDVVERGEAAREEFAVDHALGEAFGAAEPELQAEFIQPLREQALVARTEARQAIAHDDPVGRLLIDDAALAARLAHHFRCR